MNIGAFRAEFTVSLKLLAEKFGWQINSYLRKVLANIVCGAS